MSNTNKPRFSLCVSDTFALLLFKNHSMKMKNCLFAFPPKSSVVKGFPQVYNKTHTHAHYFSNCFFLTVALMFILLSPPPLVPSHHTNLWFYQNYLFEEKIGMMISRSRGIPDHLVDRVSADMCWLESVGELE